MKDGILILDKPKDITSREACVKVRKILNARKAGNSGTLDPNATGVLLICVNKAVKIMPALQGLDKEYVATIHFHQGIPSGMKSIIEKFTGKIKQVPPVHSAVARKERTREVYSMDMLGTENKDAIIKIKCQSGTYIRKIASDMGSLCGGAHLKELRRTAVGNFNIEQAVKIEEVSESSLLPIESGMSHLKKLELSESGLEKARSGKPLVSEDIASIEPGMEKNELISVMHNGSLLAMGRFLGYENRVAYIERVI